MSSRIPFEYIDIRVFAHATEDIEKVLDAFYNLLQLKSRDIIFKKNNLTGHHGNPITILEARIKEKNIIQTFIDKLSLCLSIKDKKLLQNEIKQHLDRANLYIRFDKQAAYLNELKLCATDPIHFRIHFKKRSPEEIVDIFTKFGVLS